MGKINENDTCVCVYACALELSAQVNFQGKRNCCQPACTIRGNRTDISAVFFFAVKMMVVTIKLSFIGVPICLLHLTPFIMKTEQNPPGPDPPFVELDIICAE